MAKKIIGTIIFLGTLAWIPFSIYNLSTYEDFLTEPRDLIPSLMVAVPLLGIYYLIITKFWRRQTPTSKLKKLNYEIELLKKQAELKKLKKEINQKPKP